jgi:hypothetical protein
LDRVLPTTKEEAEDDDDMPGLTSSDVPTAKEEEDGMPLLVPTPKEEEGDDFVAKLSSSDRVVVPTPNFPLMPSTLFSSPPMVMRRTRAPLQRDFRLRPSSDPAFFESDLPPLVNKNPIRDEVNKNPIRDEEEDPSLSAEVTELADKLVNGGPEEEEEDAAAVGRVLLRLAADDKALALVASSLANPRVQAAVTAAAQAELKQPGRCYVWLCFACVPFGIINCVY